MKLYFTIYFDKINWANCYDYDAVPDYTNNTISVEVAEDIEYETVDRFNKKIKDKKINKIYKKLVYNNDFIIDGNLQNLKDSIESSNIKDYIESSNIIINKIINNDNLEDIESEEAIDNYLNKLYIYLDDEYNIYADIVFSKNIEGEVIDN